MSYKNSKSKFPGTTLDEEFEFYSVSDIQD